jgi:hypothetical protein
MKKLINFVLSLFRGSNSWTDHEGGASSDQWSVPIYGKDTLSLKTRGFSVTYMPETNTVLLLQTDLSGEVIKETELSISTRVFTKINNVIKKAVDSSATTIPTVLFKQWEEALIDAQGEGENTYKSSRFPASLD